MRRRAPWSCESSSARPASSRSVCSTLYRSDRINSKNVRKVPPWAGSKKRVTKCQVAERCSHATRRRIATRSESLSPRGAGSSVGRRIRVRACPGRGAGRRPPPRAPPARGDRSCNVAGPSPPPHAQGAGGLSCAPSTGERSQGRPPLTSGCGVPGGLLRPPHGLGGGGVVELGVVEALRPRDFFPACP
jgi:hypothetical protein